MHYPIRLARTAGLLYLLVCLLGMAAHLVVRADVYFPDDAIATFTNLAANAGAFRLALVADIGMATAFALLGVVLFRLLADVDRTAATAMLVFVAVGAGLILANLGFHHAALLVATDAPIASSVGSDGSPALTLLFLDLHHHGYSLAGIFFGLWLLPLGYLAIRSGAFPRLLGFAVVAAGVTWIVDTLLDFAVPDLPGAVQGALSIPKLAEFWLLLYLLVRGVRTAPAPRASEALRTSRKSLTP